MTGIEYLNSEDCPNIKSGMGLNQIQLYVIAGILEAYHKKQLIIDGVVVPKGTCCEPVGEGFYLGTSCPKCKQPFRQNLK